VCKEKHITADIVPERADITADITCLQFENEQFEYIICNHVMEHVIKEKSAFSEVRRCLSKSGIFILTVPIFWEEKTYEDTRVSTEKERIQYYGQADHVRLYGNDIVDRVQSFGFKVDLYLCDKIVDEDKRKKFGYIPKDAVLICRRQPN